MSNSVPWTTRLAGFAAAKGIAAWMRTLEYRSLAHDRTLDPQFASEQSRIYVFWHENILLPLYLRPHCNLAMLLSRHKDAEVLARVASHMGFDCVRGSTKRGGAAALLEMRRRGQHMHLTMTPDGPRGPRRELSTGTIFLASKLGLPIVPIGLGCDRPWRASSWDQFAVPRPFSRARCILGPEIHIPSDIPRDQLEVHRLSVEKLLTDLTDEAEAWAVSGAQRQGEVCERSRSRELRPKEAATVSDGVSVAVSGDVSMDASEAVTFQEDSPWARKSA